MLRQGETLQGGCSRGIQTALTRSCLFGLCDGCRLAGDEKHVREGGSRTGPLHLFKDAALMP